MRVNLRIADGDDVSDLLCLRAAVNHHLTSLYGNGVWSAGLTEKGVLFAMRISSVYVVRQRNKLIATLTLSSRKPWAIDRTYFSPSRQPLYLTALAVHPSEQGKGVGTLCLKEAQRIAQEWPADAIRLDAWDAEAGAGEFYKKCGFQEVGRATYRDAPLIYFEMLL